MANAMTSNPPIADTTMRPIAQSVGVPKATDPALMATIPQMSSRRVLPVCLLLTHGETAAVPEEQIRRRDVGCGSNSDLSRCLRHDRFTPGSRLPGSLRDVAEVPRPVVSNCNNAR